MPPLAATEFAPASRGASKASLLAAKDLAEAESHAQAQLQTCQALAQAMHRAAEALLSAGAGLQRESPKVGSAMVKHARGEQVEAASRSFDSHLNLERDSAVARVCRGILSACSCLGVELVGLASVLTGDIVTPMHEMHRMLDVEWERQRVRLAQAEQQEAVCRAALEESRQRKDKASLELQERMRRSKSNQGKRTIKWLGFGKESNGNDGKDVEAAARAQTAAVEEFAARTDQVNMARLCKEQGVEDFGQALAQVSQRRREVLRRSLRCCAVAWEHMALSFTNTAAQFSSGASALESDVDGADLFSLISATSAASGGVTSAMLAGPYNIYNAEDVAALAARSKQSIRRMPRLPLPAPKHGPLAMQYNNLQHGGSSSSSSCFSSCSRSADGQSEASVTSHDLHVDQPKQGTAPCSEGFSSTAQGTAPVSEVPEPALRMAAAPESPSKRRIGSDAAAFIREPCAEASPYPKAWSCPDNHPLIGYAIKPGWPVNTECDVCGKVLAIGATVSGCRQCDYDRCQDCSGKALTTNDDPALAPAALEGCGHDILEDAKASTESSDTVR